MNMTMTFDDLLPLMPLLTVTFTAVIAMLMIGIRRSYILTSTITITGLLIATVLAVSMMSYTNQQITPLLIIDQYSDVYFDSEFSLLLQSGRSQRRILLDVDCGDDRRDCDGKQ